MRTGELSGKSDEMQGGGGPCNGLASHRGWCGEVLLLLVASCYEKCGKSSRMGHTVRVQIVFYQAQ